MASRLYIVDSGGTTRLVRRLPIVDAGGVTRAVKKLWVIDAGGVARRVFRSAYGDSVLTVGTDGVSQFGYNAGYPFGSMSPATYTDGSPAVQTVDLLVWTGASLNFWLAGAAVPDTDATFASLTLDGTTLLRSAATYTAGVGGGTRTQWNWATGFMHGGATVAVAFDS